MDSKHDVHGMHAIGGSEHYPPVVRDIGSTAILPNKVGGVFNGTGYII